MKPNHILILFFASLISYGCSQPMATSLLTKEGLSTDTTSGNPATDPTQLSITPDNPELAMNVDTTDKIEITGNCTDLDRKKNRIIVEVFAGEDENATPYISNAISDKCQTTAAGLVIGNTCFWVTKGVGIIEGSPVDRSFPQCHDGRFGFAVKLGKILENPVPGNLPLKYTVRFKLRTIDGILSDSSWNRVAVNRTLDTPTVDKVTADKNLYSCLVETSPARFNLDMQYVLKRSFTDANTTSAFAPLYVPKSTLSILTNDSVFSWLDDNNVGTHAPPSVAGIISGVTYNYSLTSTDNALYSVPYSTAQTAVSNVLPCKIDPPEIVQTAPASNIPIASGGNGPTCVLGFSAVRVINPAIPATVTVQWGYSSVPQWTGPNGNGAGFTLAFCDPAFAPNCTATALAGNALVTGSSYFFAVREVSGLQTGKWSNLISCLIPP